MSQRVLGGGLWLVLMCVCAPARADDAEDRAVKFIEGLHGNVARDDSRPGKPVVAATVMVDKPGTDLKELAGLKNITELCLIVHVEHNLKGIGHLPSLTTLHLWGREITGNGLKELAALPNLTSLALYGPKLTADELGELSGLKKLTSLRLLTERESLFLKLSATPMLVSSAGIKKLAGIKNLTSLHLPLDSSNEMSSDLLKELRDLKSLTALTLEGRSVTDADVGALAELAQLTTLDLTEIPTLSDYRGLKKIPKLNTLVLPNSVWRQRLIGGNIDPWVHDGVLRALRHAGLLHVWSKATAANDRRPTRPEDVVKIDLGFSLVTSAGIEELAELKNLQTIVLDKKQITNDVLKVLSKLKLLHALDGATAANDRRPTKPEDVVKVDLSDAPVATSGAAELIAFTNLTALNLSGTRVAGLKDLAPLRSLTDLNLRYARITEDSFEGLAAFKALRTLNVNGTEFGDAGLKALEGAEDLTALHLSSTRVTDGGMKRLRGHKALATLDLRNCEVTDAGIKELASLPKLTSLNVRGTKVTEGTIAELRKALPECEITK